MPEDSVKRNPAPCPGRHGGLRRTARAGDGMFTAADAKFALFKIEVTNADGTTSVVRLAQAGITSINLKADLTSIDYADGSMITGQTTFTRSNGTTGTVANTTLASESAGYAVTKVVTTDGSGNRVVTNTAYASDGSIAEVIKSVTSPSGNSITTSFDVNGDGVWDQVQGILTATVSGVETETLTNKNGGNVLLDSRTTVTSADGKTITISRDSTGGGWFDSRTETTSQTANSFNVNGDERAAMNDNYRGLICLAA